MRCTLYQKLRRKLNLEKFKQKWQTQLFIWNLLFSYEFLQNDFTSQILTQGTSNDALWMCII